MQAEGAAPIEPMEVAREFQTAAVRVATAKRELADAQKDLVRLEGEVLDLIEAERLPASFKLNGKPIYTREDLWASPKDGDHDALVQVLQELELREYLPRTVNSQSISAYVRGECKDEHGGYDLDRLDPSLRNVLKITPKPRVIATGL